MEVIMDTALFLLGAVAGAVEVGRQLNPLGYSISLALVFWIKLYAR